MIRSKAKQSVPCMALQSAVLMMLLVSSVLLSNAAQAGVQLQGWKDLNPFTIPDGTAGNQGSYQYVLFGKYSSTPIVWRILSADQTGTTRKGYLYSEKALLTKAFDGSSNNYGRSSIRTYLVSDDTAGFYISSNFTDAEKSAVVVHSFTTTDGNGDNSATTTNNAMFLPSSDDLIKEEYGFSSNRNAQDVNRKATDTSNGGGVTGRARPLLTTSSMRGT